MKKLHIVLILSFILTPFFILIDTFEPAQAQHRTTKSTIVLIEAGLEIKYLKAIFQDMEQYYRVYSYTLWQVINYIKL
jgi:hypothetical protein